MSEQVGKIKVEKVDRPELAKHDSKLLDLAFAMDCTGSMGSYIESARNNIRKIVEEIVATEKSDIRLALVEYRDHPPQDTTFVTRVHDFTPSPNTMKDWLNQCAASGGGDTPEAVADALHDVLKLNWRDEATKICVCISDAPPHGLGIGADSFPDGSPSGIDPIEVTNQLAQKGVTIYMVGCEPSIIPYKDFFLAIAYMTGGQYVPLAKAKLLSKVIVGGAREEMSLESLMAEVDAEIQQEVVAGREVDAEAMSDMLHQRFKSRGNTVNQLQCNNAELTSATSSPMAKKFSGMTKLSEVRSAYQANPPPQSMSNQLLGGAFFGFGGASAAPPPGGVGFSAPAPSFAPEALDSYACVETGVTYEQSSRMVQKSIARNFASKKK